MKEERQSFESGGHPIVVEVFGAQAAPPGPAVIMLHGADGLYGGTRYRSGARNLAGAGFQVFMVHYLDRTGETRASFATVFQNFPTWMATIREALAYVASRPGVDPHRIGVVGISLGAALGLAVASQQPGISAFVSYFGPYPQGALGLGSKLPPTLILHGGADPIVPVANAHAIESLLRQQGSFVDTKIYPGQGHGFHGDAERDATRRALAFLRGFLLGSEGPSRRSATG
jgi:carboxymethylenebutenolidase